MRIPFNMFAILTPRQVSSARRSQNRIPIYNLLLLLLLSWSIPIVANNAKADWILKRASSTSSVQMNPHINNSTIVWQDLRNGNWDIYGKNLETGEEFPVCTDSKDQVSPYVWRDKVVWLDEDKINGYDLTSKQTFTVTSSSAVWWNNSSNKIDEGIAVWKKGNGVTRAKNVLTGNEFTVSESPYTGQDSAAISYPKVVWRDDRNSYWMWQTDIYCKDLQTGLETAVCDHPASQEDPAIYGDVVVWSDNRNGAWEDWSHRGNWDIYGKNLETGNEFPVFTIEGAQRRPSIWEHTIVCESYDPDQSYFEIIGYDIPTKTIFAIASLDMDGGFRSCSQPSICKDTVVFTRETLGGGSLVFTATRPTSNTQTLVWASMSRQGEAKPAPAKAGDALATSQRVCPCHAGVVPVRAEQARGLRTADR
jgi:beta propeller repeat protein